MSTVSEPIASKEDAHPMSPPLSPTKESDNVSTDEKPSSIKHDTAKRNSGETASNMSETLAAHTESISDKRNHEFHTLFKSIPEDDNLVEGNTIHIAPPPMWLTLGLYNCRLWVCVAKGNLGARPALHLGSPSLFQCQHLWLGDERKPPPFFGNLYDSC